MEQAQEIPYSFYQWVQKKLAEHADGLNCILRKDADQCLRQYKLPKLIRPVIIKELVKLGMLKTISRDKLEIINMDNNFIENTFKLYAAVGIITPKKMAWNGRSTVEVRG